MYRFATARSLGLLVFLVPLLLVGGCGSSDSPSDPMNGNGNGNGPPPPPPGNDDPVPTTSVTVRDNVFDPAAIVVSTGATVTWTWSGSEPHNITWADSDLSNSPIQSSGDFQATMPDAAGELVYYCTLHGTPTAGMRGTIRIE